MKRILLSLAAALCMSASAAAQTVAPFKDGDRAVFLGNSITDGGHYHSYIWLYYMTRFPYMDLRVMNAGIGGETAGDMYKRLDGDVLSKRPTVLTVTFGMNDTGYMEYNGDDAGAFGEKKYRECYDNFKKMEKRLQTLDGVRVVMLGGSPYDETAQIENNAPLRGKNAVMDRVVGFQKESAAANGWEFVDFSAPMVEIGRRVQAGQPSFSLSMGDRNYYYGLESFFNTVAGVVVPGMIGAFLGATADHNWLGGNINLAYKLVTLFVFALTIIASAVVFRGRFSNPPKERFIYLRFDVLWNKMMRLAVLKGIAQGYIVTAPSMLVMTLVGNESTLGTLQSVSAIVSAVLLYLLGRFASARHRVLIFSSGLLLFALGGAFNAVLYSATGAIVFMLCLVMGRPLMDLGYFPIQLRVIDYVSRKENRNSYAYIFVHEFALYLGRFFGCGLFIVLTICLSDTFAIRYALLIIGIIQLVSIGISRNIIRALDRAEAE